MNKLPYCLLLLCSLFGAPAYSQENKSECQDIVYLKNGTELRGKITEYNLEGNLVIDTWSGTQMTMPSVNVKRVVQKCKGEKVERIPTPYSFRESGWYHATRFSSLSGANGLGFGLQHSSGLKLNRLLGIGVGVGMENFDPWDRDVATFPIFAEVRGYLLAKKITPFYAFGAGYGVSKKHTNITVFDGPEETWKGGWMAQGQIGYRIGNHAFVQIGIRLQRKTRIWENRFWGNNSGVDQILHKRLDIGIGLLL